MRAVPGTEELEVNTRVLMGPWASENLEAAILPLIPVEGEEWPESLGLLAVMVHCVPVIRLRPESGEQNLV